MKYYIDFITKHATDKLTTFEKIKMIIRLVRQNRVLIIENGLTPLEEAELIKQTMMVIDFDSFIGVEFFNWKRDYNQSKRLFGRKQSSYGNDNHYTVVAPTEAIKIIEESADLLSIGIAKSSS
ncbi:MAG: OapB/ArvB family protein [Candidatus Heimdallarchaeota archaeon]